MGNEQSDLVLVARISDQHEYVSRSYFDAVALV